jgi:hypothetical protein
MNTETKEWYAAMLEAFTKKKYESGDGIDADLLLLNKLIRYLEYYTKQAYKDLKNESERVQRFQDLLRLTKGLSKEEILTALNLK